MTTKNFIKFASPIKGLMTSEGSGAKVNRVIGNGRIRMWDPFLLLDDFQIPPSAGFPNHPHRGIQTLTYVREGEVTHGDNMGNKGTLTPGAAQLLTSGSGIIHSEFPGKELAKGMQLWINIPKRLKMTDPSYQDFKAHEIPQVPLNDGSFLRVILGESHGAKAVIESICTPLKYVHYELKPQAVVKDSVPAKHQGFIFVRHGKILVTGESQKIELKEGFVLPFEEIKDQEHFEISNSSSNAEVYFVSGIPLHEPVASGGPFVMNTPEEIELAYEEFYSGNFIKKKAEFYKAEL
mmetsp:Transcript_7546/g.11198  ORF Transcript_7546/g.11198 Transcript_7546/m.11198 type:complete len:293 (-) Transcript_7546:87-965(-)